MNSIDFLKICTQAKMTAFFLNKRSVPCFAITCLHEFWKGIERKPGGIEIGLEYAGTKIGFWLHFKSLKVINTWFYQGWMSRGSSLQGKERAISQAPALCQAPHLTCFCSWFPPQPLWKLINSLMPKCGNKWAIPKIAAHDHYYR